MRAPLLALAAISFVVPAAVFPAAPPQHNPSTKLPRQLDKKITWRRDPVTGELRAVTAGDAARESGGGAASGSASIHVRTQMVPVTCIVSTADGAAVPGLRREDFKVFEDSAEQPISYFDASTEPASVALVIDASPSVLPDAEEMKRAADALVDALAPLDRAAVIDFSAHTYLQLPFSDAREQVRRAVARVDVRALLGDTGGSNIYEAVYLAGRELFSGRTGRKAIVLLTDGQDSGLGLTLDPASMAPQLGEPADRLTFDDVARLLAAEDIQVFAVSTENRPKVMTPEWLAAHREVTLVTPAARASGIPPYTLYLAEIVRRAGGQLYFLREAETMADTFRKIAEKIRAEYTLGFYPALGADGPDARPGWHSLRVEVPGQPGVQVTYRAAYYVPTTQ
ncbi:MAG: VWA domain-containing protein [Candidatus Acidiferrales bacterium]|jgi:Ca-activated chloride channel family protein